MDSKAVPSSSSSSSSKQIIFKRSSVLPRSKRNLSFIITCLQGHEVVLELKNDSEVRGYIEEVSDQMDVTLLDCRQTTSSGEETTSERMVVKGSSIRYVHISTSLRVSKMTSEYVRKLSYIARKNAPSKFVDRPQSKKE